MDPMELWRQWYETGTKMWSNMLGGKPENYIDPYGLYRQWFNSLEDAWERIFESARKSPMGMMNNPMMAAMSPAALTQPTASQTPAVEAPAAAAAEAQNLWKQWFEAAADSWQKAAALGKESVDLAPRWAAMLDKIRLNLLSAEGFPTDPLQFATRWYNATSGPLSEFVGDLIEREDILESSSEFMKNYAVFYKVFREYSEEYLKALQIPVRSDVARVAGLVVALEDKIDRLEEAFEDFEYGYAEPATAEALEAVEERIERLEQTLERIEGGAASTADSVSDLDSRLDDVESKIDRLLAALENAPQNGGAQMAPQANGPAEIRATAAARRKAQELGVDLSEVEGTGSGGQITVDDVRRKGAS
jgi:pyruvate/2-oxoglutarate dehydrogenase complex dihydrolipoamide acyltransferase (E2) component